MRFDLRFTTRPIEEIWCQAVVTLSYKIQDRISEHLDRIDKKMGGSIRKIIQSGIWSGECGEKLLFATKNSIRADKLLIYGLGNETVYSIDILKREITNLGNVLDKMNINEFGFFLPQISEVESEYIIYIETAIKHLTKVFIDKYKDDSEYTVKIFISLGNRYIESTVQLNDSLRRFFPPYSDFSIIPDRGNINNEVVLKPAE